MIDAARAIDHGPDAADTAQEFERRLASLLNEAAKEALHRLTVAYEHVRYGGVLDDERAESTRHDADLVVAALRNVTPPVGIERAPVDPIVTEESTSVAPRVTESTAYVVVAPDEALTRRLESQASADIPMPGTLRVVRRHANALSRLVAWNVLVDGRRVSKVRDGATIAISLPSGPHEVSIKSGSNVSQVLQLHVEPGGTVSIECGPDGSVKLKALNATLRSQGLNVGAPPSQRLSFIEAHVIAE